MKVIEAGSYDYFLKPLDTDVLRHVVERAVEKLHIQRENRILRQEISRKSTHGDLIGSTEAMSHVFDSIKRMARATTNVIIRGESGVGKELVARALHEQSDRRNRAFVSVNCAALPEGLMEAELFGYEKGAFTGAVAMKEGRVEMAHQGTLFLNEIATLTLALQSKLQYFVHGIDKAQRDLLLNIGRNLRQILAVDLLAAGSSERNDEYGREDCDHIQHHQHTGEQPPVIAGICQRQDHRGTQHRHPEHEDDIAKQPWSVRVSDALGCHSLIMHDPAPSGTGTGACIGTYKSRCHLSMASACPRSLVSPVSAKPSFS